MTKTMKKYIISFLAAAALCIGCLALFSPKFTVKAEEAVAVEPQAVFQMEEGASVRIKAPNGIRFRLQMNDTYKSQLDSTDKVGMLIFPSAYLSQISDNDYTKITPKLDLDLTSALYKSGEYWYGNGVITNIKTVNINREFIGIGYTCDENGENYEFADFTLEKNARSAAYVAEKAYKDYDSEVGTNATSRRVLAQYLTSNPNLDTTYGGFGTEAYPYSIYTEAQFKYFANQVKNEGKTYADTYFVLKDDLEGITIKVGKTGSYFSGIFDGNEKTVEVDIKNSTGSETHIALFALNNGTIKNLTVTGSVNASTNSYVAGIVAVNEGTVSNCINEADIEGASYVGGIVGRNRNIVENCTNNGAVAGDYTVGGIVGHATKVTGVDSYVKDCTNTGEISTTNPANAQTGNTGGCGIGGIVGVNGSYCPITSCINRGNVTGGGGERKLANLEIGVGGIAGSSGQTSVTSCENYGTISGYYNVAQIVGYKNEKAEVSNNTESGTLQIKTVA